MEPARTIPECAHRSFDDLTPGQRIAFETSFSAADVDQFAALSGDWNPLHVDDTYVAQTPHRRRVAHGMLVASLLSRVAGMHFPGKQSLLLSVEHATFHNPVFVDEALRCEAELVEVHAIFRVLVVEAKIFGSYGKLKLSARLKVQYRADAQPRFTLPQLEDLMKTDLSKHVALVTGASRGIGAAIAEALGQCHATVIVNYNASKSQAEDVAHRIEKAGGKAVVSKADVSRRDDVAALVKSAGPIDLFVHNATAPLEDLAFADTPWSLMERDFDLHVGGAYNCLQEILPGMTAKKFGRIVTMLTVTLESPPPKGYASYVTAKSGLMGLTRCIASEYARFGITANMVAPGMVETDLTASVDERSKKMIAARIPAGRLANPGDVVGPVLFLLSPAAEYINGAILNVNGGLQF